MAKMKAFRVSGVFKSKGRAQDFNKEVLCESKKAAEEKILSDIGSRHRVKRRDISIMGVQQLKPEEIENPIIRYKVEGE